MFWLHISTKVANTLIASRNTKSIAKKQHEDMLMNHTTC